MANGHTVLPCLVEPVKWAGPYPEISLNEARFKREECRQMIAQGIDPLEKARRYACQAQISKFQI